MNVAMFGVGIDPAPAQSGANAAAAAIDKVAAAATRASKAAEDTGKAAGKAATNAGAASQKAANDSRRAMQDAAGGVDGLTSSFGKLIRVVQGLAITAAFISAIKAGIQFNMVLEDAQISIAAVQRTFAPEKFQDFNAAMKASAGAIAILKQKAQESPATFQALVGAFQATAGAAARANLSMRQHIDLVVMMSQAMKGMGIQDQQIVSESRALLTGNIDQNSDAAKTLGITREDISKAKAAGQLFEFLTQKMSAFAEAGKVAAASVSVQLSNMVDKLQDMAGLATKPIFEALRDQLAGFLAALNTNAGQAALASLGQGIAQLLAAFGSLMQFLANHAGVVLELAKVFGVLWLSMKAISFGDYIRGLIASTMAVKADTAAVEANGAAKTKTGRIGSLMGGVAVTGAMMAGGDKFTMLGSGLGAMFGPVGMAVGAGLGLAADKIAESMNKAREATTQQANSMRQITKELAEQVGAAKTLTQQQNARLSITRQISDLDVRMARSTDSGTVASLAMDKKALQEMLADPSRMGAAAKDAEAAAKMQKDFDARFTAIQREVDVADTLAKKNEAYAHVMEQINEAKEKGAQLDAQGANSQNAQKEAAESYIQSLFAIGKKMEDIAGTRQLERADAEAAARDQVAIQKALGDTLALARAKASNDVVEIQRIEEKKRLEELETNELVQQIQNKKEQGKVIQEIIGYERQLKDIRAEETVADASRTQRMRALDKSLEVATLRGQGRTGAADAMEGDQLRAQAAEAKRQYEEIARYQGGKMKAAGIGNVPMVPTEASMMGTDVATLQGASAQQTADVVVPSVQRINEAYDKWQQLQKAVIENNARIAESTPGDANVMRGLGDHMEGMRNKYNAGGMSAVEFSRRSDEARDNAAGQLSDPKRYEQELGRYRAFQREKELAAKEADARIAANGMTATEALGEGFKRAGDQFGNMSQQMVKASEGVTSSIANGLSSALADMANGSKDAKTAFRDMAISILNDIARLITQLLIELAIRTAIKAVSGFANGGQVGGGWQANASGGAKGMAVGGTVTGGSGGIDDIPTMLTAGEYVIRKSAVDRYGVGFLNAINHERLGKYAEGGAVAARQASGGAPSGSGRSDGDTFNITVNVDAGGKSNSTGGKENAQKSEKLGREVEGAIMQVIVREKRPGGILAK